MAWFQSEQPWPGLHTRAVVPLLPLEESVLPGYDYLSFKGQSIRGRALLRDIHPREDWAGRIQVIQLGVVAIGLLWAKMVEHRLAWPENGM